jgi:hypothetical protein
MSNATLKRLFRVLPQSPPADFEWPPNAQEQAPDIQAPYITETEQSVPWCVKDRPTDEEPARFANETVDSGLNAPCADFTWPPSPEELAEFRIIEAVNSDAVCEGTDVEKREPLLKSGVPAPLATSAIAAWVPTQLPAAVTDYASSEPLNPARDSSLAETVPAPPDANEPEYTCIDGSTPSGYVDSGLKEPYANFTWPPSPEDLAQYRIIEAVNSDAVCDGTDVEKREPLLKSSVPAPLTTSAISAWVPTQLPAAVTDATWRRPADARFAKARDASSEPLDPGRDSSLAETVPNPSDADDPEYTRSDDSMRSGHAVVHNDPALEGNRPAGWAAEIARLQELIEGLTEKFECRIANVVHTERQPRN